ncbi:MAG TPA: iron-sulfur cluster repair di-iron protein [Fodinibius sp.]|nr:iron-sulfur cluster repair di-iron protein [Fodinibius sp.]
MDALKERTVGQIVAEDYRAAQVFRTYGLDFCCGGTKTIEEAAATTGADPTEVKKALEDLGSQGEAQENYNEWALDFLTDYIINNHHQFVRNKMPEIEAYAKKVAKVHGDRHPELHEIYKQVTELHVDLVDHLNKEEAVLFPYIKQLTEAEKNGAVPENGDVDGAADPVSMMEEEHDEAGETMANIRDLSSDFTPPEDACTTYSVLFQNLEGFEKDLHKHVHLENNILFPKALELEKRLN